MKNLFKVNIFTYIFLILSMLSGYFREMFIVFLILLVHELGHFFLMSIFNISVSSITIYPYGGMIKSNMLINTNSFKIILISLGGIIIQSILWVVVYILFKFNVIDIYYYEIFYKYNISIILFNLLPIYPLDGFKIINSILEIFVSFKKSLFISFIINLLCLVLFFIYLYIFKVSNYIIIIFLLVSLMSYIKDIKYLINKFYIERVIYDIKYNGLISVSSKDMMYKNKYNYIKGIGEKEYLKSKYDIGF